MTARTSIIVVNWNTRDLTLRCLASIRARTTYPHQIIVVDNGSSDGSVVEFRGLEGPDLRVIALPENVGFAAGNNEGIRAAAEGDVCLLNSDTIVTRRWLSRLHDVRARTGAGMCGPCTSRCRGRQRHLGYLGLRQPFRRTRRTTFLSFFCVLIGREVLNDVGLLDTRFGLGNFEDDDYCRRAAEAGYTLWIAGRSWVWHVSHATFGANGLDLAALHERNRRLYADKWSSKDKARAGHTRGAGHRPDEPQKDDAGHGEGEKAA